MEKTYRLFVINPGSTSTRVAYYENEKEVCGTKLVHPAEEIAKYKTINDQLPMRRQMVHKKYRRKWLNNSKQFSEKRKRISKENECLTKER